MIRKLFALCLLFSLTNILYAQKTAHPFRVRTVTAGISLNNLADTTTFNAAIEFLKKAKQAYIDKGYEVQTIRISTQNLYKYFPFLLLSIYTDCILYKFITKLYNFS